jgi:hypothetical protein
MRTEPTSDRPSDRRLRAKSHTPRASTHSGRLISRWYDRCDQLSGGLIYFAIIFGPWAFGTTQPWSIWTTNVISYTLGVLWLIKVMLRSGSDYRPPRWLSAPSSSDENDSAELDVQVQDRQQRGMGSAWLIPGLAVVTVLILGYTLISALNARATFGIKDLQLEYHPCLMWLPHSYDRPRTWFAFAQYLGWACLFWSVRDWLLGKTKSERYGNLEDRSRHFEEAALATSGFAGDQALALPHRLRRLLWIICLNGGLLAAEGVTQRVAGGNKLLGLVKPRFNQTPESQFGPYAYRSSATQYLNLVWPVGVAFCWVLGRRASSLRAKGLRVRRFYLVLVPACILMAVSPIVSTTRGGTIVAGLCLLLIVVVLIGAMGKSKWQQRLGIMVLVLIPVELALFMGWSQLWPRFEQMIDDGMGGRQAIYDNARQMAVDHPVFGTGPGTFMWLYYFYRQAANEPWAGYVHDDWLELRITFGWVGFSLILLALVPVVFHWFSGHGIAIPWVLMAGIWIALAGCLVHAAYDLPMQVHSVVVMFLLNCCIAVSAHRQQGDQG